MGNSVNDNSRQLIYHEDYGLMSQVKTCKKMYATISVLMF